MNHRQALEQVENDYDDMKRQINRGFEQIDEERARFNHYLESLSDHLVQIQQSYDMGTQPLGDLEEARHEGQVLFDRAENALQEKASENERNFYFKQEQLEEEMRREMSKDDKQ